MIEPLNTRTQLTAKTIIKNCQTKVKVTKETIMYILIGDTRFDIPMDTIFTISSKGYDKKKVK